MNKGVTSKIYALSFLWLMPLTYASPYVTAQFWADMIAIIAILLGLYDLSYILILRQNDNVSFGRAVARFFLYGFIMIVLYITFSYIKLFFWGYNGTFWFGYSDYDPVYGFEAIKADVWSNLIFVPMFIISTIYICGYFLISKKISKS